MLIRRTGGNPENRTTPTSTTRHSFSSVNGRKLLSGHGWGRPTVGGA